MATKFARRKCLCCEKKLVGWKLISIPAPGKLHFAFVCFPCAEVLKQKLALFNTAEKPNKKEQLAKARAAHQERERQRQALQLQLQAA